MKAIKILIHIAFVILLTLLTQVGGLVYLLALLLSHILKFKRLWFMSTFILFYLVFNLAITPAIAPVFGRTALPWYGNLRPLNVLTCLFNRHYVTSELKEELEVIAKHKNELLGCQLSLY